MRKPRLKADPAQPVAYYHVISRVVNRDFVLGQAEKEHFLRLMRRYETFSGVRIVTFCVMSNHFHLLVEVPQRPSIPLSDEELLQRIAAINGRSGAEEVRQQLDAFRRHEQHAAAEQLRARYLQRMWDVSFFMKTLKQRFTQWFNARHKRVGILWEQRFKSVLVEAACDTLATMAAYIDLNPVRAGIVADPKDYRWCGYAQTVAGDKRAKEGLAVVVSYFRNSPVTRIDTILRDYRVHLYMEGEQKGLAEADAPVNTTAIATAPTLHHAATTTDIAPPRAQPLAPVTPLRKGFTPEAIAEVLANNGKLTRAELLRCRVRYFVDGCAIGSKAFVDQVFESNRSYFGPKRLDGARRIRHLQEKLYSIRNLNLSPVTPPSPTPPNARAAAK